MISTYRGATLNTVVAAAGADMFFVITGSATVTRRVRKIRVSGDTLTTLAVGSIVAEKWSTTAPTGGTEVALTRVPLDSAFPAAATDGLVQVYTAAAANAETEENKKMIANTRKFGNPFGELGEDGIPKELYCC